MAWRRDPQVTLYETTYKTIAKGLLWAVIKLHHVQELMGGLGHTPHVCVMEPWDPPDPGPWEGVCSPRVCPCHQECLDFAVQWADCYG